MRLDEILLGAHVALRLIQARLITILALLTGFGLFCWAMYLQTILSAIIASVWGLLVFLPVLVSGRGGSDHGTATRRTDSTPGESGEGQEA